MTSIGQKIGPTEYNPYLEAMRWQGFAEDFQAKLKTKELELEDLKKKFSDAVGTALVGLEDDGHTKAVAIASLELHQFIIPAPKPDPLVEVLAEVAADYLNDVSNEKYTNAIRAALEARGLEIREKNDE